MVVTSFSVHVLVTVVTPSSPVLLQINVDSGDENLTGARDCSGLLG